MLDGNDVTWGAIQEGADTWCDRGGRGDDDSDLDPCRDLLYCASLTAPLYWSSFTMVLAALQPQAPLR
jgi:hypothetical protein